MSGLAEIQEAIIGLPENERLALVEWLNAQNSPVLDAEDEKKLLNSLDAAIRDLDSGIGISIALARNQLKSVISTPPAARLD
jgi:hypothetical protein